MAPGQFEFHHATRIAFFQQVLFHFGSELHVEIRRKKIFKEIAPKYAERNGGYTRIIRTGIRRGDAAETAIIELV